MAVAAAACAFLIVCWILFAANRRSFGWVPPPPAPDVSGEGFVRTTLFIPTPSGDRIEAWLYHPGRPAPVVIMAPGLCGTKEGPLERFAEAFAGSGLSVVTFDFRTFGGSEGSPRHDIDPKRQVSDFVSVVDHVRTALREQVDATQIVLWGTSFSGATALCACNDIEQTPSAILLHVPYLGQSAKPPGRWQLAGYVGLTIAEMAGDWLAGKLGVKLPPIYITAYGRPGERAFAASKDCPSRSGAPPQHPFWRALPEVYRGGWRNLCLVRGLQHLDAIDPGAALLATKATVLVVAATEDDMVRIEDTRALCAASPSGSVQLVEIACAHFDPYVDPHFRQNACRQIAFLQRALSLPATIA